MNYKDVVLIGGLLFILLIFLLMITRVCALEVVLTNNTLILDGSAENLNIFCLSEIDCSLSSYNKSMSNETQMINITTSYPSWFPAKNVTNKVLIFYTNDTGVFRKISRSFDTYIAPWAYLNTPDRVTKEVFCGNSSNLLTFFIHNKGNEIRDIIINITNPIFEYNDIIKALEPNEKRSVWLYFDVKRDEQPQIVQFNISIDNIKQIPVNLTIIDNIPPEIKIIMNDTEYMKDIFIEFNATDNIAVVGNITIEIAGPGGDIYYGNISLSNPIFKFRYTDLVGEYEVKATVKDASNNIKIARGVLNVTSRNIIIFDVPDQNDYGDIKSEEYIKVPFLTLTDDISVNITLDYLSSPIRAKIFIDDENVPHEILLNETYEIKTDGIKFLGFRGNGTGTLDIVFKFITEENVDLTYEKLNLYVDFIPYETPEYYETVLFGQFPMVCEPVMDAYNQSHYDCLIEYPLDIDLDLLTYPTTKGAYDRLEEQYNNSEAALKNELVGAYGLADMGFTLFVFMLLVVIIYMLWSEKIKSVVRFKLR